MVKKKGKKTKCGKLYAAACFLVVLVGLVLFSYAGVRPVADFEYRWDQLSPAVFTEKEASFAGDWDPIPEKGQHVLLLRVEGGLFPVPVLLRVADTAAPGAEARESLIVPLGTTLSPEQLITNVRDNDVVQIYFETAADFLTVGPHTVQVAVEDLSGNKSTVTCAYAVRGVGDGVTVEAGALLPETAAYLIADPVATGAELISEYREEMTHHVGQYDLVFRFRVEGTVQQDIACLTVVDTVPPTGSGVRLITEPGQEVTPASFVTDAHDETDIAFAYAAAPDPSVHEVQDVVVRMTDEGGNSTDVPATLIASTVPPVQVEARREPLTAAELGLAGDVRVEPFVPSDVGAFLVKVWIDGREEASYVTVTDTTAPALSLRDVGDIYVNHPLQPEELFAAEDVFDVSLAYTEEPRWTQAGEQTVAVTAVDTYGNRSQLTRQITILDDTRPPVIYGAVNRNVYEGERVVYLMGVWAEDDVDGSVAVAVDSKVDVYTEGRYDVTYTAMDRAGNAASVTCVFTVIPPTVTEEEVRSYAQKVMDEITTPDMVDAEKLQAIYWYVRNHVRYGNGTNKNYTDWRRAARDGFVNGKGDCYNIWAVTRALLDQTDIEYVSVERVKSARRRTRHYWVNVNVGTGWYVFDPTWTPLHKFTCFMWTKKQCDSCKQYWQFDYDKFPPLATEPFDYDAVVAAQRAGRLP